MIDETGADVTRAWQILGRTTASATLALICGAALADETPAPVPAPHPDDVNTKESAENVPAIPQVLPGPIGGAYGPVATYGTGPAYGTMPMPPVNYVGEYRVGHVKTKHPLARYLHRSFYHPYVDEIHQPYRQVIYQDRHAKYYVRYHALATPQWDTTYVPVNSPYCPPEAAYPHGMTDPNMTAPYGPGSATYFGAYRR